MNTALRIGKTLWVHKDGRTFLIELDESSKQTRGKENLNLGAISGSLKSPMPGKILKIENKIGQKVKMGQTVCVIEAMKMEYALKAPFEGQIKEVFKKVGDQVLLNEKVMQLEELK